MKKAAKKSMAANGGGLWPLRFTLIFSGSKWD
jgi:hypothetical protein